MNSFWSAWIIILTVVSLVLITWILFANRKTKGSGPDTTTGHVYDGIEEYDNPLPAWWFYLFVITLVFGVGYLLMYPGLGSFKGLLGWTQHGQWQKQLDAAEQKYGKVFAEYAAMPIEEVVEHPKALKMGQRLFANNCAQCHGSDAQGSYGFANLVDEEWLYGGSPEQIKTSIANGRTGAMPGWQSVLGDQGVINVSAYVLSLSGREVDDSQASSGAQQYQMFCSSCHGVDGTGSIAMGAPDLTNSIWLYGGSAGLVQRSIRNGRNGQMPAHKDLISEDKIHLLAAYVYSLSQREPSNTQEQ